MMPESASRRIHVSEIYCAPQGEGPHMGRPSVFVRTQGCPLQCGWCDTPWTWNAKHPDFNDYTTYSSPGALADAMMREGGSTAFAPPQAVVFTGGEPALQDVGLAATARKYREVRQEAGLGGVAFEVETAGTVRALALITLGAHFNVSPKMPSAGNQHMPPERLWNRELLAEYVAMPAPGDREVPEEGPTSIFKIVVSDLPEDQTALLQFLLLLKELSMGDMNRVRRRVYLMPCATTAAELAERLPRVIDTATTLGVHVTTRLHVAAFGNQRRR